MRVKQKGQTQSLLRKSTWQYGFKTDGCAERQRINAGKGRSAQVKSERRTKEGNEVERKKKRNSSEKTAKESSGEKKREASNGTYQHDKRQCCIARDHKEEPLVGHTREVAS